MHLSQTCLPGIPSCGGVPGRPSWALSGAPSLSVGPPMTRPSLVPSPCGTLWNVLLVKENHNPFIGFSFSKVKFNHILGIYSYDVPNFCFH